MYQHNVDVQPFLCKPQVPERIIALMVDHAVALGVRTKQRLGPWNCYDGDDYEDKDEVLIWPDLLKAEQFIAHINPEAPTPRDGWVAFLAIAASLRALKEAARLSGGDGLRGVYIIEDGCAAHLYRMVAEVCA